MTRTSPSPNPAPADPTGLRRLPTRDPQPPFDDELPNTPAASRHLGSHGQGALALAFALPGGLPAEPGWPAVIRKADENATPHLRLVPPIGTPVGEKSEAAQEPAGKTRRRAARDLADEEFGPQQTPRVSLPEPTPWAGRLVQALIEVVSGVRPISQLVRWTTTDVYDCVSRRVFRALNEPRPPGPRRFAEVVRSVHVSEPVDGVAEVCAIVQQGPRCRAIALRLEGIDGRWQCTALQIG